MTDEKIVITQDKICVILSLTKKKDKKVEEKYMLNDEIRKKREELNKSIEENRDYDYIYKISVELDELIADFYREEEVEGQIAVNR